jgi:hypothetical protein
VGPRLLNSNRYATATSRKLKQAQSGETWLSNLFTLELHCSCVFLNTQAFENLPKSSSMQASFFEISSSDNSGAYRLSSGTDAKLWGYAKEEDYSKLRAVLTSDPASQVDLK